LTGQLTFDRPEATHQAQALDTIATDLAAAVAAVLEGLAGLGDYCGTDASGTNFAASYQPHVDRVEPALSDAVGDVAALAGGLRLAATAIIGTDQQSAEQLLRIIGEAIPAAPAF
jgi:hypothetical protein